MKHKLLRVLLASLCVVTCTAADVANRQMPFAADGKGEVRLRAFVGWGGLWYIMGHDAYDDEEEVFGAAEG